MWLAGSLASISPRLHFIVCQQLVENDNILTIAKVSNALRVNNETGDPEKRQGAKGAV